MAYPPSILLLVKTLYSNVISKPYVLNVVTIFRLEEKVWVMRPESEILYSNFLIHRKY